MNRINMMLKTEGYAGNGLMPKQGEQIAFIKESLSKNFEIVENSKDGGDITHYYSTDLFLFFTISAMKKRGKTIGFVHVLPEISTNSVDLPRYAKKIFYKYIIAFYKKMDYLITVNPSHIEILKRYGIKGEKIFYIPDYVSTQKFHSVSELVNQASISQEDKIMMYKNNSDAKAVYKKAYQLDEERFTVLSVEQVQNMDEIEILFEIALQMPEVQFLWIGDYYLDKLTNDFSNVEDFLQQPPENVKFLGLFDEEEMNDIYRVADVLFLSYFGDKFPAVIVESMHCSIPVLVRELEAYRSILSDYTLAGNSNEEFIHILTKLMIDTLYYRNAVEKAEAGDRFYSKEHISQMWLSYYNHILFTQSEEFRMER